MTSPIELDIHGRLTEPWGLDRDVTFLNHGSFGATPTAVLDRQHELRARMEAQPVRFFLDEVEGLLDASRARLAEFVGADASRLAFVPNATTGVNAILRSLDLADGDELLTTDHAYGACRNALDFVAARTGARVTVAPVPFPLASRDDVVERVLDAVTSRTRLALIDHVTSATGLVLPIERLVTELEARGVATLVDGAHAPGMLPLDLEALGASWYVGNCHKWICAPKGAGFVWVRGDHAARLRPVVISHGAAIDTDRRPRLHLEFDWVGTVDPTPWMCVGAAIDHLGGLVKGGWPALQARNRALALAGRDRLCEALGVAAPAPDDAIGTLAAVPLPDDPEPRSGNPYRPHRLHVRLLEEHGIEVPIVTWPRWPGRLVRISAQAYVALSDVDKLADALRRDPSIGG